MHALGQVHRLEIGGECTHQVGGMVQIDLRQRVGQSGHRRARFAAHDLRAWPVLQYANSRNTESTLPFQRPWNSSSLRSAAVLPSSTNSINGVRKMVSAAPCE